MGTSLPCPASHAGSIFSHCRLELVPLLAYCAAEAAEVLFDHGQTDVYSSTREQLEAAAAAVHAPPAAASPHGGPPVGSGVGEEPAAATRGRRHHRAPPSAAPATASEPSAAPDKPSVPSGERTAATTRGG